MSVELPKDAEGREIPLDTGALYDEDGNVHSIRRFIYTTDFDLGDKWMNSWTVVVDDGYKVAKPEQLYLTPHDSWKKLEDDLGRVASCGDSDTPVCTYARQPCAVCEFHSSENCTSAMCADIASRIRKLRGEE